MPHVPLCLLTVLWSGDEHGDNVEGIWDMKEWEKLKSFGW